MLVIWAIERVVYGLMKTHNNINCNDNAVVGIRWNLLSWMNMV